MTMKREDRLRELELLPVWRLRRPPQPQMPAASAGQPSTPPQAVDSTAAEDLPLDVRRSTAIMAMDWESLQESVSLCQACSLAQTRHHTVFGTGDTDADWLFVGEAPGVEEDQRGEPFVGAAGQLLDNMLAAIALQRGDNVYIANVLKCRPPENRDPHGEEVVRCDPFLKRQVALIQPRLIVALG
ncbi:MAG: uracil-DNA glycosylase, partial [Methylobacterium sp.]|nr:uracil-DNA glycosylase [Methylobacterium sp.]